MTPSRSESLETLWSKLEHKFCADLRRAFSSRDIDGWLEHFYPHRNVDVFQFGQDVTGKTGTGKTVKVFSGGWLKALWRRRLPMALMAKILFKRLNEQGYDHSNISLLGVRFSSEDETRSEALVSFERINKAGDIYASAIVIYRLERHGGRWLITTLSNYDVLDDLPKSARLETFWQSPN